MNFIPAEEFFDTHFDATLTLTRKQICDFELIANGGFAPLEGFQTAIDYFNVLHFMKLANGSLWPMPIYLDVSNAFAEKLFVNAKLLLQDEYSNPLGYLKVESLWIPNKEEEAQCVYATLDDLHPGVRYLNEQTQPVYVGGPIFPYALPSHYDFTSLRLTPEQLKACFKELQWDRIIAFQTRNPMHRAHYELTRAAAEQVQANLLIHPVVGQTKPGDIEHYIRIKCYKAIVDHYPKGLAKLALLPLAMRMAGPKEALWHGLIRKNYGCTHFIVGRDHAGPGNAKNGEPFYKPYEAQELFAKHQDELDIEMVPFEEFVYSKTQKKYVSMSQVSKDEDIGRVSGTEFRAMLLQGKEVPQWFSFDNVLDILNKHVVPMGKQGFCLFFTGLSGSGKSTLANAIHQKLYERYTRTASLLDGDVVRKFLSSELGFSKEDRSTNIKRIAFVSSEIVKFCGIAICAPIAPYESDREAARKLISPYGDYIEIYVSTPLEVCEHRDTKGLYQKARKGLLKGFTGIDDPYDVPKNPDLILDTSALGVEECIEKIFSLLNTRGYLLLES